MHKVEEMVDESSSGVKETPEHNPRLLRVGMVTALILAIHNFPEGMVTFLAGLKDVSIAIPIAIAIAIHNIPEGFPYLCLFSMPPEAVAALFGFLSFRDLPSRWGRLSVISC